MQDKQGCHFETVHNENSKCATKADESFFIIFIFGEEPLTRARLGGVGVNKTLLCQNISRGLLTSE